MSSFIGIKLALSHAVDMESVSWQKDFENKRLLVVGSGPSLDCVTDSYFAKFDALICINHAILKVPEHPCIYYVSTDVPRTVEVMEGPAKNAIDKLEKDKKILFLSFVLAQFELFKGILENFTVVRYREYYFHKWGKNILSKRFYQPKVATDEELKLWISGESSFSQMPSRGGSSAFSALLLAARYRPSEIRLIGVDLNSGRSVSLKEYAGSAVFGGGWAINRYMRLQKVIEEYGVPVINDSWTAEGIR